MEVLNNHLHRLSTCDDERLASVIPRLLPELLANLNTSDVSVRSKAVEVLSHLSRRVRPNRSIALPNIVLLQLTADPRGTAFTRNFAAAYLEMGVPRLASPADRGAVGAAILGALSVLDTHNSIAPAFGPLEATLVAAFLCVATDLPAAPLPFVEGSKATLRPDRIADLFLDVLICPLLRPEHLKHLVATKKAAAAGNGAAAESTPEGAPPVTIPPGLSPQRLMRLVGKHLGDDDREFKEAWTSAKFSEQRKLALIKYLPPRGSGMILFGSSAAWLGAGDAIALLLVASADGNSAVADAAASSILSLRRTVTARSAAASSGDLGGDASNEGLLLCDDPTVAVRLLKLFLNEVPHARSPWTWRSRHALLEWVITDCQGGLKKIVADDLPFRVVNECLFGDHGSMALRSEGAALAHFMAVRSAHLPELFDASMRVLARVKTYETSAEASDDRSSVRTTELFSRCCSVASVVAQRFPAILNGKTHFNSLDFGTAVQTAATLFAILISKTTSNHLKVSIGDTLESLSTALSRSLETLSVKATDCPTLAPLRRLLFAMARSTEHRARLSALTWAAVATGQEMSTYLAAMLREDAIDEVRNEAHRLLKGATKPSASEFLGVIITGGDGVPPLGTLQPRTRASALSYASDCLAEDARVLLVAHAKDAFIIKAQRPCDLWNTVDVEAEQERHAALAAALVLHGDGIADFQRAFRVVTEAVDVLLNDALLAATDEISLQPAVLAAKSLLRCLKSVRDVELAGGSYKEVSLAAYSTSAIDRFGPLVEGGLFETALQQHTLTSLELSDASSEILGVLVHHAPKPELERIIDVVMLELSSPSLLQMSQSRAAPRGVGIRTRSRSLAAIRLGGFLVEYLPDPPSQVVRALGNLVGCKDDDLHRIASRAITRSISFGQNLPEPNGSPASPEEHTFRGGSSRGEASAENAPGDTSIDIPDAVLAYGSIEAAASAGDRTAVREMMRRRDGVSALVHINTTGTSLGGVVPRARFGGDWIGAMFNRCATMLETHSEDAARAASAAAVLSTAVTHCPSYAEAAVSALVASCTRNDAELHFSVATGLASHALRPGAEVDLIDRVLLKQIDHSPVVRRAGGAWLLCILTALARARAPTSDGSAPPRGLPDSLAPRLSLVQQAFLSLLLDRRQTDITHEVAALGLSATAQVATLLDAQAANHSDSSSLLEALLGKLMESFKKTRRAAASVPAEGPRGPTAMLPGGIVPELVAADEVGEQREAAAALGRMLEEQARRGAPRRSPERGAASAGAGPPDSIDVLSSLYSSLQAAAPSNEVRPRPGLAAPPLSFSEKPHAPGDISIAPDPLSFSIAPDPLSPARVPLAAGPNIRAAARRHQGPAPSMPSSSTWPWAWASPGSSTPSSPPSPRAPSGKPARPPPAAPPPPPRWTEPGLLPLPSPLAPPRSPVPQAA